MKTLYLDIFSGISGDMFIGAMLDLGVNRRAFERELEKLGLREYRLQVSRQERGSIAGTKFDVHLVGEPQHRHVHEHSHDASTDVNAHSPSHGRGHETSRREQPDRSHEHSGHDHDHLEGVSHGPHGGPLVATKSGRVELSVFETNVPPRFRLYFFDGQGHAAKPPAETSVTLETVRGRYRRQQFKFKKRGDYLEATHELPEPHEFQAMLKIKLGAKTEKYEAKFVEDHQHHDDSHSHEHGRTFADIFQMIQRSSLSPWVKEKAVAVFRRIALAEGKIHGHPPEQVHFHEVGAVDSIVDIVGACIALEILGKPRVLATNPIEGTGTIRCAHGTFPIPAPATLEILAARGVAIQQCDEPGELVTPTGAAILAEFAESFGPMQSLALGRIGYGLGARQNRTRPNVLRAVLGRESAIRAPKTGVGAALDWETDSVAVIETNLDDINSELLGAFAEKVLANGALDVFHTAVQMKKNRPGVLLTVLCATSDADTFSEMILRETTAFGVRRSIAERRKLRREVLEVKTGLGKVAVKIGRLNGRVIHVTPEFESCRKIAAARNVPLKQVYEAALKAAKYD